MNRHVRGMQRQYGQGLIEFIITIAVLGPLLLGIFQAVLLYRAKTLLDYAALQAARSGATNFAQMDAMQTGLARGLMPLYATDASATGALAAYTKALAEIKLTSKIPGAAIASIQIVSPTQAAFDSWKVKQFDGTDAIPNDSLAYRGGAVKSGMTVQDANILKIEVHYKYPLIVPLIDSIIGHTAGALDPIRTAEHGHKVYSLDIVAQAIVRMQTPIRDRSLLASGNGGDGNQGSGDGSGGDPGSGSSGGGSGDGGGSNGGSGNDGGSDGGGSGAPPHVCT